MQNMLIRTLDALPGDTWTDNDGTAYVIYNNMELPNSTSGRKLQMIIVKDGQCRQSELSRHSEATLVIERPQT